MKYCGAAETSWPTQPTLQTEDHTLQMLGIIFVLRVSKKKKKREHRSIYRILNILIGINDPISAGL